MHQIDEKDRTRVVSYMPIHRYAVSYAVTAVSSQSYVGGQHRLSAHARVLVAAASVCAALRKVNSQIILLNQC